MLSPESLGSNRIRAHAGRYVTGSKRIRQNRYNPTQQRERTMFCGSPVVVTQRPTMSPRKQRRVLQKRLKKGLLSRAGGEPRLSVSVVTSMMIAQSWPVMLARSRA